MYENVLIGVRDDEDDRRATALAHRLASPATCFTLVHVTVASALGREDEGLEPELDAPGGTRHAFAEPRAVRRHATAA